jgi:hypothetical protein
MAEQLIRQIKTMEQIYEDARNAAFEIDDDYHSPEAVEARMEWYAYNGQ